MARRIFIVARGNVAVYNSLSQALRREQDVEIIYDRRSGSRRNEFSDALKKVFSRGSSSPSPKEERRTRAKIDEQIRTQGWAVVRIEGQELSLDDTSIEKYKKLRSVWSTPRGEDPVVAVLVEHSGVCLDCLAEKAKLSLERVMVAVRRTQTEVLLAFVTRACALCSRKSLVAYVRDRVVARTSPFSQAGPRRAQAGNDQADDDLPALPVPNDASDLTAAAR